MGRLSVAAVLLLVAVPLCMYTCALLFGVELGRAVERRPDTISLSLSVRGVLDHVNKELWDPKGQGKDVDGGERVLRRAQAEPVGASRPPIQVQPNRRHGSSRVVDLETSAASRANTHYISQISPRGAISLGPWGGAGGRPFYQGSMIVRHLGSIVLYHSSGAIHSLAYDYEYQAADDAAGNWTAGPWGHSHSFGNRAARARIELDADEHVTAVEGTTGRFANFPGAVVVTSLTFRTSAGRTYGPYGDTKAAAAGAGAGTGASSSFSIPAADGACVVGFWGRSGDVLDAIGVYIKPSCTSATQRFLVSRAPYYADARKEAMMRTANN